MPRGIADFVSAFSQGISPAMLQALAMKRALIAAGELGLEEQKVPGVPGKAPWEMEYLPGVDIFDRPTRVPGRAIPTEMYPGATEVPLIEEGKRIGTARPLGKTRTKYAPTGMGNLRKLLATQKYTTGEETRQLAKEKVAMAFASDKADMFKDPEAYNQAYTEKINQLNAIERIVGMEQMGAGIRGVTGGVEGIGGAAGAEELDVEAEVDLLEQQSIEIQDALLNNPMYNLDPRIKERFLERRKAVSEEAPPQANLGVRGLGAMMSAPFGGRLGGESGGELGGELGRRLLKR